MRLKKLIIEEKEASNVKEWYDPKDKGYGILVEDTSKKMKMTLQQNQSHGNTNDEELLGKIQAEVGCRRRRKRFKHILKTLQKTLFHGLEKERGDVEGKEDAKKTLTERKATIAEEQH
ncbi:hypothetical protein Tco_0401252 [Tanacetum coccineum]